MRMIFHRRPIYRHAPWFGGEVYAGPDCGRDHRVSSNAFSLAFSNLSQHPVSGFYHPSISTDGRYVAFKTSFADRAGITAIFRKDRVTDELVLISTNGIPQGNGLRAAVVDEIFGPEMSADGRFVAYGNRVNRTNFTASTCGMLSLPTT